MSRSLQDKHAGSFRRFPCGHVSRAAAEGSAYQGPRGSSARTPHARGGEPRGASGSRPRTASTRTGSATERQGRGEPRGREKAQREKTG